MNVDCAIVGGGPAGLNAALVLGRARKSVALIDNSQPRNAVTHASHGFLTRDGIQPSEFRKIAYEEVLSYPSVNHISAQIVDIKRTSAGLELQSAAGEKIHARKLILATGLKETLPHIAGIHDFYGKSVFPCPFCDGWEHRDQPLAVITDDPAVMHRVKLLYTWSKDLVVCTNGAAHLTEEQKEQLAAKQIKVVETPIASLSGVNGKLENIHFSDGTSIERSGALLGTTLFPSISFHEALGYETTSMGGITTNDMGKTTVADVFAAGDSAYVMPSQLIIAAASGSRAAAGVVAELMEEDWEQ